MASARTLVRKRSGPRVRQAFTALGTTAEDRLAPTPSLSPRRRVSTPKAVLAVAVLGCFMAFVDATIVNIAVPNIARHFSGSSFSSISWVLNAYNIVFAAFLV